MKNEHILFYNRFVTAVQENKPATVAELLTLYPFLVNYLEEPLSKELDPVTPFFFAVKNTAKFEVARILCAFGAFHKWGNLRKDSAFWMPRNGAPIPVLPEMAALKEADPQQLKTEIINKYHLQTIEQLYILTGVAPENCDKTMDKTMKQGPHLRFTLHMTDSSSIDLSLVLKLFGIQYCADLYKPEQQKIFITITPDQYPQINALFSSNVVPPDIIAKNRSIDIDQLTPETKVKLFDLLFSRKGMHDRNHKYPMVGVMSVLSRFMMENSPCFQTGSSLIKKRKKIETEESATTSSGLVDSLSSVYLPGLEATRRKLTTSLPEPLTPETDLISFSNTI